MCPEELKTEGLYICLLSIHGLIRGHDLELGRDADTAGDIIALTGIDQGMSSEMLSLDNFILLNVKIIMHLHKENLLKMKFILKI